MERKLLKLAPRWGKLKVWMYDVYLLQNNDAHMVGMYQIPVLSYFIYLIKRLANLKLSVLPMTALRLVAIYNWYLSKGVWSISAMTRVSPCMCTSFPRLLSGVVVPLPYAHYRHSRTAARCCSPWPVQLVLTTALWCFLPRPRPTASAAAVTAEALPRPHDWAT